MTDTYVLAADTTEWWDVDTTKAAVLDILRLGDGDIDEQRIVWLVPVAGQMINQWMDRPAGVQAPDWALYPLQTAIETVTVSLYRDKDAPPTTIDGLLAGSMRPAGLDPLIEVRAKMRGAKQRWGIG
jgi:hypothetical protein